MYLIHRVIPLILGFFGEFLIGWPNGLYHPIMLIGKMISAAEKLLRSAFPKSHGGERAAGIVMAVLLPLISPLVSGAILLLAYRLHYLAGLVLESLMCWSIFAARSLKTAAMDVYRALDSEGIEAGRRAVSMIVGRDTEALSISGVVKAAVETVAENLSDGVIAPMLFVFLGGAPFGYFYKTVNTMDSMVGYKNDRYLYYGTGAARLDDVCNYIPARLSGLLMIACSRVCGLNAANAWKIFCRDRYNHASPNSAQTESVMAGALEVQLAGDAYYFGKKYAKKTIGDPIKEIQPSLIPASCRLMSTTSTAAVLILTAIAAIVGALVR